MNAAAAFRFTLRNSMLDDEESVVAIYAHHVRFGFGSFEEKPPSVEEMHRRRESVLAQGLPFLVADADGHVVGYAYAAPYRTRSAYRFTL